MKKCPDLIEMLNEMYDEMSLFRKIQHNFYSIYYKIKYEELR